MKAGERGPQTLHTAIGIRATLTCAWCGREVTDAKARRDVAGGRIFLVPTPTAFRLSGGQPLCIVCSGPLLLEDWKAEAPELSSFDPGGSGGSGQDSAAA